MSSAYKRPTPRPKPKPPTPASLNTINVPASTMLYKGISNNKRIYTAPVFFTFSRNYAKTYAKARLGEYMVKSNLKLLRLTKNTINYLLAHSSLNKLEKDRLRFITGVNMSIKNQIKLVNLLTTNEGMRKYIVNTMLSNLVKTGVKNHNKPGGRKSFMDIDFAVYKSLCAFCKTHGYDGVYVDELTSPYHEFFGSELVLCNPRASLVSMNFPLNNA